VADHSGALSLVLAVLEQQFPQARIAAVGHRVVHGGLDFAAPALVTDETMQLLATLIPLAPLHQPHNLSGIAAAKTAFPGVPQVACFDTAFHRAHPFVNDTFALPRALYDQGVRRYGFHGLSYEYVTGRLAEIAPFHAKGRVVICHLGSGASMCAVRNGHSVASTMGFSPLDGLPMGTRPGQLDPGVLLYLMEQKGMGAKAISDLLYKESGLKGLSGISNDMRDLEASDDPRARQAIDYFVFRVRREIGGMAAVLEGLDTIVFCGGIGENSRMVREAVLETMEWIGVELDLDRNRANADVISSDRSGVRVFVIRTDEELMIARHTAELLASRTSAVNRVA
jgi:acetate kinase